MSLIPASKRRQAVPFGLATPTGVAPAVPVRPPDQMGIIGWVVYSVLSVALLSCIIWTNRSRVADNDNYVNGFLYPNWDWLLGLWESSDSLERRFFQLFTEEAGWRVWCGIVVDVLQFSPESATKFTACLLNVLIILGASRTARPLTSLLIWAFIPFGFALTGFFQIRQGFAFGILMFFTAYFRWPTAGVILASTIHTTAALMIPFAAVSAIARHPKLALRYAVPLGIFVPISMVAVGTEMFWEYGGRRLETYSVEQGASSINFVIQCALTSIAPASILLLGSSRPQDDPWARAVAMIHLQTLIFVSVSFFLFPIGTARVGYYIFLLLVPLLGEMRHDNIASRFGFLLISASLIYQALKQFGLGGYNEVIRAILAM